MTDNFSSQFEIIIGNKEFSKDKIGEELPVLPLKNMVFLPGIPTPVNVARTKSLKAIQEAQKKKSMLAVFCQKDGRLDEPMQEDLFPVGVVVEILNILEENESTMTVLLHGERRIRLDEITNSEPFLK